MSINDLNESWAEVKENLLEGLQDSKREVMDVVLENQRNYLLKESAAAGSISASDIAAIRNTALPIIRRVIPGSIAPEIVGVQAMKGPLSQVFTMRYVYEDAMTHDPARSPFGGFDVASGDEAFGNAKPLRAFYSGTNGVAQPAGAAGIGGTVNMTPDPAIGTGWSGVWAQNNSDMTFGGLTISNVGGSLIGGNGAHLEGSGGRRMGLKLVSQAVEATSRKLQSGWTLEAEQDAKSQHGIDIEAEMVRVMSAQIVQEIDAEIITDLLALAGTVRTFDYATMGGPTYTPHFAGDKLAGLGIRIAEVSNEIARKTRKGEGNFIVVSPMVVTALQAASKSVFAPAVAGAFEGPNNTKMVGTLNGKIKVYSYLWNQAQSLSAPGAGPSAGNDTILVGYKGGNGETDAGYFYLPYIPITTSGRILNPITGQPVVMLTTRYGKLAFTNTTSSLGNSADYYGKINVTNLDFV